LNFSKMFLTDILPLFIRKLFVKELILSLHFNNLFFKKLICSAKLIFLFFNFMGS